MALGNDLIAPEVVRPGRPSGNAQLVPAIAQAVVLTGQACTQPQSKSAHGKATLDQSVSTTCSSQGITTQHHTCRLLIAKQLCTSPNYKSAQCSATLPCPTLGIWSMQDGTWSMQGKATQYNTYLCKVSSCGTLISLLLTGAYKP